VHSRRKTKKKICKERILKEFFVRDKAKLAYFAVDKDPYLPFIIYYS
jgi:hypothetical protein